MKRIVVLVALLSTGALSIAVAAYQQPQAARGGGQPAARVVEVEKLKDNFFILRGAGGGGNTSVFVQANGVTVVDTKNPGWGQPILDKIKELTPKPVTMIINTHTHGDHVSGNVEFPTTVDIVVQENTAANMKKMAPVTGLAAPAATGATPAPTIFEQNGGKGLPKRTFKDKMTIGSGADQIDLFYFGRGHTNGDAWVLFPALRVVTAGDIFAWSNQLPILDANNGGSGVEIAESLMKAHVCSCAALIRSSVAP
jgi:glyoxylase-like metal-dependent hydrolase (beta-lactamase superfamily II)